MTNAPFSMVPLYCRFFQVTRNAHIGVRATSGRVWNGPGKQLISFDTGGKFMCRSFGYAVRARSGRPGQFAVYPEYSQREIMIISTMDWVESHVFGSQLA